MRERVYAILGAAEKNMIWTLQLMYGKRCRNQTSRSNKTGDQNCSSITCIQAASLHSGCYSFMTCSSYTTRCKARKMSQNCDFCWERSFLCSISSKGSKRDSIYYTHLTKFNTIHSWGQALLVKISTNGVITQMSPALWAGPRRTQQAAGKSILQWVCTLKKKRNPKESRKR